MRALTREAVIELRDKLVVAMTEPDPSIEEQLDRVSDAFRDGLGQRLAWFATVDPDGDESGAVMIRRDIADHLHARRVAATPPGTVVAREEANFWCI